MTTIRVVHDGGDRFAAHVRGHTVVTDQPTVDGGSDAGPTPVELFVTSLATCVGHYAHRYLARHPIDPTGLAVTADFTMATDRPARVTDVRLAITPPAGLPAEREAAFLAVASACTVHHTLDQPPVVTIRLDGPAVGQAA